LVIGSVIHIDFFAGKERVLLKGSELGWGQG
jgi:hypothetical protein